MDALFTEEEIDIIAFALGQYAGARLKEHPGPDAMQFAVKLGGIVSKLSALRPQPPQPTKVIKN